MKTKTQSIIKTMLVLVAALVFTVSLVSTNVKASGSTCTKLYSFTTFQNGTKYSSIANTTINWNSVSWINYNVQKFNASDIKFAAKAINGVTYSNIVNGSGSVSYPAQINVIDVYSCV
jgi:hypothetical protein